MNTSKKVFPLSRQVYLRERMHSYGALYRKTEETVDYGPFTKTFTWEEI